MGSVLRVMLATAAAWVGCWLASQLVAAMILKARGLL